MFISRYSQHLFVCETNLSCRGAAAAAGNPSSGTPWSSKGSSQLLLITVFLLPLMMNVSYVGLCSYEGHVIVHSRGIAALRYPHRSLKHLLFNVSVARRSLLMAPSNPPFPSKDMWSAQIQLESCVSVCVCVCVCSTGLSGCPLT